MEQSKVNLKPVDIDKFNEIKLKNEWLTLNYLKL